MKDIASNMESTLTKIDFPWYKTIHVYYSEVPSMAQYFYIKNKFNVTDNRFLFNQIKDLIDEHTEQIYI